MIAQGARGPQVGSTIRVFTLDRERDGTIVEVLVVSSGRGRQEHRGERWPAAAYAEARDAIRVKNESLFAGALSGA